MDLISTLRYEAQRRKEQEEAERKAAEAGGAGTAQEPVETADASGTAGTGGSAAVDTAGADAPPTASTVEATPAPAGDDPPTS